MFEEENESVQANPDSTKDAKSSAAMRKFKITTNTNAKQRVWKDVHEVDREFLEAIFSTYREDGKKDGACFLPGTLIGTERKTTAVNKIEFLVYDVDGRQTYEELEAIIKSLGVYAFIYSTYNHLTKNTEVKVDHYLTWAQKHGLPESDAKEEHLLAYLADKGNRKDHLKNPRCDMQIKQTAEGQAFFIAHDPLPKLRVVFPLSKPIVIAELAIGNKAAVLEYKSVYHGVGRALGIDFDTACEDPSRLYYFPSCKPGAEYIARCFLKDKEEPPLLDWTIYPRAQTRSETESGTDRGNSRSNARRARNLTSVTDKNGRKINVLAWYEKTKLTFLIEEAVHATLPENMIRSERSAGGFHFECPNEAQHSTAGGDGTFCVNSDGNRSWNIFCSHNSCQSAGMKGCDYLAELIVAGYITADDLENPEYGGARLRPSFELPVSGGFIVPLGQLDSALAAMNERWAVIKIGNKTRFMAIKHDGTPEFLDSTSMSVLFEAAYYQYKDADGEIELGNFLQAWRSWIGRRQYSGYGFFPAPDDHRDACPEGHYNAYRGFSVEPKKGCWKRMLGHLYRNVCCRDRQRFRWLMAWLAQMVQQPHIKPGTHVVMRGKEGVGKSKLGEWIIRLFGPNAMPITSAARLAGRFNAHMETLLFGLVEEAIWAGDKTAEGALKALATAEELDYERKGMDPVRGRNYTRLMFASNEDWVVPSASGGRRWFVIEVGDEHEKDYAYFKALDDEMNAGGLAAMLYDLQRYDSSAVNVREAPVTEWLVDQRLHSYDTKRRWWRDVLGQGGFRIDDGSTAEFVALGETFTTVAKEDVFRSARPHFGTERRKATESDVGTFLSKMLKDVVGFGEGPRVGNRDGGRTRTYNFPSLSTLREAWKETTGEDIEHGELKTSHAAACEAEREDLTKERYGQETTLPPEAIAVVNAVVANLRSRGVTDPVQTQTAIDEALTAAGYPPKDSVQSSRRSAA